MADTTSAQTSAMLSSIHLLADSESVLGIEVTERKATMIQSNQGADSFAYRGGAEIKHRGSKEFTSKSPSQARRDDLASLQSRGIDVIDLSAVDSASLSPARIMKAIRTGQPLVRNDKSPLSKQELQQRPGQRVLSKSRERRRRSKSPSRHEWRDSALQVGSGLRDEGVEVEDIGELNEWLDSVIA
jgi:hypothetical protein